MKGTNPNGDAICPCPCEGIIEIIGKKWALCAMTTIKNEVRVRFNQLQSHLPGISSKTLTETLRQLESAGVIKRDVFAEIPPRVEYSLTPSGSKLSEAIAPLMIWSAEHPMSIPKTRISS